MWRPAVSQLVNSVEAAAGSPGPGRGQPRRRPEFSLGWMHTGVHECPDGRTVRTDFWIVIMSGRWLNTISERDVSVIDRVYRFFKKHKLAKLEENPSRFGGSRLGWRVLSLQGCQLNNSTRPVLSAPRSVIGDTDGPEEALPSTPYPEHHILPSKPAALR